MSARDLLDKTRAKFVDASTAPTRAIVYTRNRDLLDIPLNSFVSGIEFNQDDEDSKKVNRITCRTLILDEEPTPLDTITYDGKIYKVRNWDKSGNAYTVEAENAKRNKVSSRKFK